MHTLTITSLAAMILTSISGRLRGLAASDSHHSIQASEGDPGADRVICIMSSSFWTTPKPMHWSITCLHNPIHLACPLSAAATRNRAIVVLPMPPWRCRTLSPVFRIGKCFHNNRYRWWWCGDWWVTGDWWPVTVEPQEKLFPWSYRCNAWATNLNIHMERNETKVT